MTWRFWRRRDLEEAGEKAISDAMHDAWMNRHRLRQRLGIDCGSREFISGYEDLGEVSNSIKELWAAVDALEKRTKDMGLSS